MTETVITAVYFSFFFFFNDTATTEIYTLSLHDALPISAQASRLCYPARSAAHRVSMLRFLASRATATARILSRLRDRKSTRLNSSHLVISYAVFCLKKKKTLTLISLSILTQSSSHRLRL